MHLIIRAPERQKCRYPNGYPLRTTHSAHGIGKLIVRQGLVCILLRKILVSLGQALASGCPLDCRILLFEPLNVKNADTRMGICCAPLTRRRVLKTCSSPGARLHFASQNIGFARSSSRERQSTGLPHITVRAPERQKCRYPSGYLHFWWLARGSNPGPTP